MGRREGGSEGFCWAGGEAGHEGRTQAGIVRADTLLVQIKVASLTLPCPGWAMPPVPCFLKQGSACLAQ